MDQAITSRRDMGKPGIASYKRIELDLRERIAAGEWPAGAMIPGRKDLAEQYGVALNTVQRAIRELVKENVLLADDRRGTFVAECPAIEPNTAVRPSSALLANTDFAYAEPVTTVKTAATLGIIAKYDTDPTRMSAVNEDWVPVVVRSLERVFSASGGRTHFFNVHHPDGKGFASPSQAAQAALRAGVDALVIVNVDDHPNWTEDIVLHIDPSTVPMLYLPGREITASIPQIFNDHWSAGYHAAEHLIASGYRKIVCLKPYAAEWLDDRYAGVQSALLTAGFPIESVVIAASEVSLTLHDFWQLDKEAKHGLLRELLLAGLRELDLGDAQQNGVCAVVASSDHEALAVIEVMHELGIRVGSGIGVISFDDIPLARMYGLTSLRPPLDMLGESAARMILHVLRGKDIPKKTRLCSHLVARSSTVRTEKN